MAEPDSFAQHRKGLLAAFIRWTLVIFALGFLVNSLWFLWKPRSTALQNGVIALTMAITWGAGRLLHRGRIDTAVWLYLTGGMVFVALATLVVGPASILNGVMGLALFCLVGAFLEPPRRALHWGLIAIGSYLVVLTIRLQVPALDPQLAASDLLSIYLFPVMLLAVVSLLARAAAGRLQSLLARSEAARSDLAESHGSILAAQGVLQAANEQLRWEIAAREEAEGRLRRQIDEAALVHRVAGLVALAQDMPEALQEICRELAEHLQVPQAGAALLNAERSVAEVVAECQPADRPSARGAQIPVEGNPSMAYVLEQRAPLAITIAQADPRLAPVHELMRRRSVVSILLVPILAGTDGAGGPQVIGTLGFDSYEEREFGADDIRLVERVSAQVGQMLLRKRAEEALRQSEETVRALLNAPTDLVLLVDAEGMILDANEAFCTFYDKPRETLVGRSAWDLFPAEVAAERRARLDELSRSGLPLRFEEPGAHRAGWYDTIVSPVTDDQGRVTRAAVVTRDISRRREMEEVLRVSEVRYRSLFEGLPTPLWEEDHSAVKTELDRLLAACGGSVADLDAYLVDHPAEVERLVGLVQIIRVNQAALDLEGATSREELVAASSTVLVQNEAGLDARRAELLAIAQGATQFEQEEPIRTLQGERRQVVVRWAPAPGHEADYARLLVSTVDVTALKEAQAATQRSLEAVARGRQLLLAVSSAAQAVQLARSPAEVYRALGEQVRMLGYEALGLLVSSDGQFLVLERGSMTPRSAAVMEEVFGWPADGHLFRLHPGGLLEQSLTAPVTIRGAQIAESLAAALPEALSSRAGELIGRIWPAPGPDAAEQGTERGAGWDAELMLAPVRLGTEVLGMLVVGGRFAPGEAGDGHGAAEREAVATLASQAAIALANAYLNQRAEAWAAELQLRVEEEVARSQSVRERSQRLLLALSQTAQLVQRGRTAEEIYRIVGEEVHRLGYQAIILAVDRSDPSRPHLSATHSTVPAELETQVEELSRLAARAARIPVVAECFRIDLLERGECILVEDTASLMAGSYPEFGQELFERVASVLGMQKSIWAPIGGGAIDGASGAGNAERPELLLGLAGSDLTDSDRPAVTLLANQATIALENARLLAHVEANRVRLEELARDVVAAQEEERRRLSRALHDEAGQALTALKISLDLLRRDLPARASALQRRVADAARITDDTMDGIRALAQDLRPPALDAVGLNHTLEGYCRDYGARIQLPIRYQGRDLSGLPDPVKITLYRCLQEGLANVAKHARARGVEVTLRQERGEIRLDVVDDGQGFAPAETEAEKRRGLGLLGIRERLATVGGRLEVQSEPGQGTRLTACIPWEEDESEP